MHLQGKPSQSILYIRLFQNLVTFPGLPSTSLATRAETEAVFNPRKFNEILQTEYFPGKGLGGVKPFLSMGLRFFMISRRVLTG